MCDMSQSKKQCDKQGCHYIMLIIFMMALMHIHLKINVQLNSIENTPQTKKKKKYHVPS